MNEDELIDLLRALEYAVGTVILISVTLNSDGSSTHGHVHSNTFDRHGNEHAKWLFEYARSSELRDAACRWFFSG